MEAKNGSLSSSGIWSSEGGNYLSGVCLLFVHWLATPLPAFWARPMALSSLADVRALGKPWSSSRVFLQVLQGPCPHMTTAQEGKAAMETGPFPHACVHLSGRIVLSWCPLQTSPNIQLAELGFMASWELQRRLKTSYAGKGISHGCGVSNQKGLILMEVFNEFMGAKHIIQYSGNTDDWMEVSVCLSLSVYPPISISLLFLAADNLQCPSLISFVRWITL